MKDYMCRKNGDPEIKELLQNHDKGTCREDLDIWSSADGQDGSTITKYRCRTCGLCASEWDD
jgi:hypothetical protein